MSIIILKLNIMRITSAAFLYIWSRFESMFLHSGVNCLVSSVIKYFKHLMSEKPVSFVNKIHLLKRAIKIENMKFTHVFHFLAVSHYNTSINQQNKPAATKDPLEYQPLTPRSNSPLLPDKPETGYSFSKEPPSSILRLSQNHFHHLVCKWSPVRSCRRLEGVDSIGRPKLVLSKYSPSLARNYS